MKNETISRIFIGALLAVMLVPLVGMTFWMTNETSEKREMKEWPSLTEEGKLNIRLLSDMGAWYEDHFAFRPWLITAYADLENALFHESSIRNVLRGKEGWLFYQETLDDYLGLNPLSEREVFNIVHNLQLIQYSLQSDGAKLAVTIAPNKNSVCPEAMKDRYLETESKDIDRLQQALKEGGILCIDLKTPLRSDERQLYFERDSHWNNEGALRAYNVLMDGMGIQHNTFQSVEPILRQDHESDLDTMLNPKSAVKETEFHYEQAMNFKVVNEIEDFMDDWIETQREGGQGTLLMFRDSFGEALAPFFAEHFEHAYFSRLTPYNLIQVESLRPDWVVIERVERRMESLQEQAAIMNMPVTANRESEEDLQKNSTIHVFADNGWYRISGTVENLAPKAEIFLEGTWPDGKVYTWPLFYIEEGYEVYLPQKALPQKSRLRVLVEDGSALKCVDETTVVD